MNPAQTAAPTAAVLAPADDSVTGFQLLHVNGDVSHCREIAAAWAKDNPGKVAHVMVLQDSATAALTVEWSKP